MTVTTFKNKNEALDYLEDEVGSHVMISGEQADAIGEPFGVTFEKKTFTPQRTDPKGVMPNWDKEKQEWDYTPFTAVDSFTIAAKLATTVGAKRGEFLGRGFQFRADIQAARKVLND